MKQSEHRPPQIILAFFRWYCNPDFREEIEGDLVERFHYYSKKYGPKRAKLHFTKEVLFLFRPTIIGNFYHLINKNSTTMTLPNKRLIGILAGAGVLLFLPFIAMKFTDEVKWTLFDFIVAGVLLLGTGLMLELILRKMKSVQNRIIFSVTLFIVLFLIWAELAVGIFGTPFAGQ